MSNCKKPNCDCLEKQAKKDGVDIYSVKGGYQCLYGDNSANEVEKTKQSNRPTPVVEAKTAEELIRSYFTTNYIERMWTMDDTIKAMEAYHAQFTPSAKSVEVEEAKTGRTHLECPNCGSDIEQADTISRLREENEKLRDEGIRLLNGIRRISEIIDDELAESICRELLRP